MTNEELVKSIRENLRDKLDELDKLDKLEEWDSIHKRLAIGSLLGFIDYARRLEEYYTMYIDKAIHKRTRSRSSSEGVRVGSKTDYIA